MNITEKLNTIAENEQRVYEAGRAEEFAFWKQVAERTIVTVRAEDLEGLTYLGAQLFGYCYELLTVEVPESITALGSSAFNSSSKLASVKLPNSLAHIESYCFNNAKALAALTIPAGATQIDGYALRAGSTTNKTTYTFLGTTPPRIQSTTFDATKLEKIIVPAGCGATYKAATNWSAFADYIEEATA